MILNLNLKYYAFVDNFSSASLLCYNGTLTRGMVQTKTLVTANNYCYKYCFDNHYGLEFAK